MFVRDSMVRKTDRALDVVVRLPGTKIQAVSERVEKPWVRARENLF